MKNFAMLSGSLVTNIIVAENKEATEQALNCQLIEITHKNPAAVGWLYDFDTEKFVAPLIEDE